MTLGGLIACIVLALAMAAAAIRWRDRFWALMAFVVLANGAALIYRFGLDLEVFVATADGYANVLGAVLGALGLFVLNGLPESVQDRLLYGPYLAERVFDRAVFAARKPFVDASRAPDDTLEEAASWRGRVTDRPPSAAWASLADKLARSDQEWAEGVRTAPGDAEWLEWKARNDQIGQAWTALRAPSHERARKRGRIVLVLGWTLSVVGIACVGAGFLGIPSAVAGAPPQGRAAFVPERPLGRGVTLVPMGDVREDDLLRLVPYYGARFDLPVAVVPAIAIPGDALDPARGQLVGENLIAYLRTTEPLTSFEEQVVIGVTAEDMYVQFRPDWRFAFGVIQGNVAVISTGRMGSSFDWFDHAVERRRLRKMVTRYIGFLLYGLPESADRSSVLYQPLLSLGDLDAMGEDYR